MSYHVDCGCPHGFPCSLDRALPVCWLCGDELRREVASGTHYDCRTHVENSVHNLANNLAVGAALCRAYHQGLAYQPYPPSPTREPYCAPGCGRSAP